MVLVMLSCYIHNPSQSVTVEFFLDATDNTNCHLARFSNVVNQVDGWKFKIT
ncbi:hypothetical protein ACH5RR_008839, partial [Cinchona calisaya]